VNIVREYDVLEKKRVERPESVAGVLACPNSSCITNAEEPVRTRFDVLEDGVRCGYCEEIIREGIADHLDVG